MVWILLLCGIWKYVTYLRGTLSEACATLSMMMAPTSRVVVSRATCEFIAFLCLQMNGYVQHLCLINSFKYHVSCTDGKMSVRINLLFYLFFHRRPIPVGLSLLIQQFQQVLCELKFLLSPGLGSWQLEFKSLIIVIDLNSSCQLPKKGDRRDFKAQMICWKYCINNKRPTGKTHNFWMERRWKIGKIID